MGWGGLAVATLCNFGVPGCWVVFENSLTCLVGKYRICLCPGGLNPPLLILFCQQTQCCLMHSKGHFLAYF